MEIMLLQKVLREYFFSNVWTWKKNSMREYHFDLEQKLMKMIGLGKITRYLVSYFCPQTEKF